MNNDPKFWDWLKNKDKPAEEQIQIQLEIPVDFPPPVNPPPEPRDPRGVFVIDLF